MPTTQNGLIFLLLSRAVYPAVHRTQNFGLDEDGRRTRNTRDTQQIIPHLLASGHGARGGREANPRGVDNACQWNFTVSAVDLGRGSGCALTGFPISRTPIFVARVDREIYALLARGAPCLSMSCRRNSRDYEVSRSLPSLPVYDL